LEQTHTPLVMRIEKAPFYYEQGPNGWEKVIHWMNILGFFVD
jgi:hypothetical protein